MSVCIDAPPDLSILRDLVQRHKVCWESLPLRLVGRARKVVHVGFELDLWGTHDHPARPVRVGCDQCREVFKNLLQIARWILPSQERPSKYRIEPFDVSIHFAPKRQSRRDILLTIEIVHRDEFDAPADDCELKCLREMEERLGTLGARRGSW